MLGEAADYMTGACNWRGREVRKMEVRGVKEDGGEGCEGRWR